jgi:hypothetical protein
MKAYKILVIGFSIMVLITTSTVFSNEVYGASKSEKFIQQNNFTVTEVKDGLVKIGGWMSSGFVGNETLSVILEFENGSEVSYNDVKALGVEYGRGFIQNNDTIGPDEIGNGFVQNNNITLSGGDFGRGFVDLGGAQTGNGFAQNNLVRMAGWGMTGGG